MPTAALLFQYSQIFVFVKSYVFFPEEVETET